MYIIYYFQIWNKKEHSIIISRVISSQIGSMYFETPYTIAFSVIKQSPHIFLIIRFLLSSSDNSLIQSGLQSSIIVFSVLLKIRTGLMREGQYRWQKYILFFKFLEQLPLCNEKTHTSCIKKSFYSTTIIVVGNGISDTSSNPGRGCLRFTSR